MPVNTTHKQYQAASDDWTLMRDVVAGQRRIHYKAEAYLPRLSGQSADEYGAYVSRATFYNATQRTVDGLSGMIFRKPPVTEIPAGMTDWAEDVTLDGVSLTAFAEMVVEEQLVVSRAGILVDFPPGGENATRAQAQNENRRPYLRLYQTETITGWKHGQVNNKAQLTQVRLRELVEVPNTEDPFELNESEQYRVLDLITEDEDGNPVAPFYQQQVWVKEGDKWQQTEPVIPQMNGQPLNYIPFVFVGPRGSQWDVQKPVLLDLANANLSHYRTVADLEHGAHYTALPVPYIFGVNEEESPSAIGPTTIWTSGNADAKTGYVEFTGKGLDTLEKRRESKEQHMASLGARMLAPEKRQAEAAETMAIRHSGEMSVLASLSQATSLALNDALNIARDWMGQAGDISIELNTDFMPTTMSPQLLAEMIRGVQGGQISQRTLFYNLQRGEIIGSDTSFEEEQEEIEADATLGLIDANSE